MVETCNKVEKRATAVFQQMRWDVMLYPSLVVSSCIQCLWCGERCQIGNKRGGVYISGTTRALSFEGSVHMLLLIILFGWGLAGGIILYQSA